jgi:hypothetical protein
MLSMCSKPPKRHMPKHIEGAPGVPRRAKRARGSALGHPGRSHVEMRGLPGPSGCGARDPIAALVPFALVAMCTLACTVIIEITAAHMAGYVLGTKCG